ncbi:hypothetical protein [Desulfatitalea alkaliphila]|uniref:DUF4156 domain-containing protein n=1 Tax=Desulfatitalea alkaliphila TaxID=2929485 RepID=A0AA41UI54_9BACT|nr:hypothetical protein [Desulfatitalea alkaliphila]MCJ8499694.1 hypothetical protein [Desulfatitalea alkaliphila]
MRTRERLTFLLFIIALLLPAGCAAVRGTGLVDSSPAMVAECRFLGMVTETADAGQVSVFWARRSMLRAVTNRAAQLGATHLVWLHRTDNSAAAQAYHCSP